LRGGAQTCAVAGCVYEAEEHTPPPLLRGGAQTCAVAGCVYEAEEHTPPPLSRGESRHPSLFFRIPNTCSANERKPEKGFMLSS